MNSLRVPTVIVIYHVHTFVAIVRYRSFATFVAVIVRSRYRSFVHFAFCITIYLLSIFSFVLVRSFARTPGFFYRSFFVHVRTPFIFYRAYTFTIYLCVRSRTVRSFWFCIVLFSAVHFCVIVDRSVDLLRTPFFYVLLSLHAFVARSRLHVRSFTTAHVPVHVHHVHVLPFTCRSFVHLLQFYVLHLYLSFIFSSTLHTPHYRLRLIYLQFVAFVYVRFVDRSFHRAVDRSRSPPFAFTFTFVRSSAFTFCRSAIVLSMPSSSIYLAVFTAYTRSVVLHVRSFVARTALRSLLPHRTTAPARTALPAVEVHL